jgi:hypothetical protein
VTIITTIPGGTDGDEAQSGNKEVQEDVSDREKEEKIMSERT